MKLIPVTPEQAKAIETAVRERQQRQIAQVEFRLAKLRAEHGFPPSALVRK